MKPGAPKRPTYEWESIAGLRTLVKRRVSEAEAIMALPETIEAGDIELAERWVQSTPLLTELGLQEKALVEALRVPFITHPATRAEFELTIALTQHLYHSRKEAMWVRKARRAEIRVAA